MGKAGWLRGKNLVSPPDFLLQFLVHLIPSLSLLRSYCFFLHKQATTTTSTHLPVRRVKPHYYSSSVSFHYPPPAIENSHRPGCWFPYDKQTVAQTHTHVLYTLLYFFLSSIFFPSSSSSSRSSSQIIIFSPQLYIPFVNHP